MARFPKAHAPGPSVGNRVLPLSGQPVLEAGGPLPASPAPEPTLEPARLWLCLHLPELPLEDRAGELSRLADWAGRFTPAVSIAGNDALLLEVRGSLRLFKGLERLWSRVERGLQILGHQARMAAAPTARAALWLARTGLGQRVRTGRELREALAGLPVAGLGWPAGTVEALAQMGLLTVGDCIRLPRAGFARRLGPERLRELDQAFGRQPEPWRWHVPPARFATELELPAETTDLALLLEGFHQLAGRLQQVLLCRQASISRVWCRLVHPDGSESRLCLGLGQPTALTGRDGLLPGLLRLRLESLELAGPVAGLALQADLEAGQVPAGRDLLGMELQPDGGLHALLGRLRARLGGQAVQGFALRGEHRPEIAWCTRPDPLAPPPSSGPLPPLRPRPLWLLPAPEPLGLVAGQPAWHGLLSLHGGPERIESGWWDGGDVRRDYYRASNRRGDVLWVFRDLRTRGWYLQGMFG